MVSTPTMLNTFEISQEPVEAMTMKPALDTLIGSTTTASSSVSVNHSTNSASSVSVGYTKSLIHLIKPICL